MISTEQKYLYTAFGLRILSDIPLPGSAVIAWQDPSVDVRVEMGDLLALWSQLSTEDDIFVVRDNFVMFQITNVAIYLVKDGNTIIVSPIGEQSAEKLRLYLDGYGMSTLLLQRKSLPLHGSAIVIDGRAYAIVGQSGAGKSTLTKAFLDRGYSFLSDDIIPVSFSEDGKQVMVEPAIPEQKLWQECLDEFGMDRSNYHTIYERVARVDDQVETKTKFAIPVTRFFDRPLPLAGIFELVKSEAVDEVAVDSIEKADKFRAIMQHTFNRALIPPMGLMAWSFTLTTNLTKQIPIYTLTRPTTRFTASELVSLMIDTIEKEYGYGQNHHTG
ncbi:aldolase [Paenibacillus sp. GSMTC-2017]|uniref:aldolase n=1 Tax=Paenibacillus sp. GSMTC-2017 TaxID=2794350 RepID=UPI0018D6AB82|nr:aldolase [Paenibacillus sp. GSMTC-2017]MBH5319649.1 aldolase [Paenibacillus sp. GSMTC-2017]